MELQKLLDQKTKQNNELLQELEAMRKDLASKVAKLTAELEAKLKKL